MRVLIRALQRAFHLHISAARGFIVDHSDVDVFTDAGKKGRIKTGARKPLADLMSVSHLSDESLIQLAFWLLVSACVRLKKV